MSWPEYKPTSGAALHPDRGHLLRWEALAGGMDFLDADALIEALETEQHWGPGRLDLRRSLARRVGEHARDLERQGTPAEARALYARLVATGHVASSSVAVRVARTHEAEGDRPAALAALRHGRQVGTPVERIGIARAGRRVAKTTRASWPPDRPLSAPPERHVRIEGAEATRGRPGYQSPVGSVPVEAALQHHLAGLGRRALHVEGSVWRTLFALLFSTTYFLEIPGQLPTRFLSAPLDVGTPAFADRRALPVEAVLMAVDAGEAGAMVAVADAEWRGVRLRGADWSLCAADLVATARATPPRALAAIMRRFLREGWTVTRGLPDLVVLPGEPIALPNAIPAALSESLVLVEVKGPGDVVRDEQVVWFDVLLGAGARVELWNVRPS